MASGHVVVVAAALGLAAVLQGGLGETNADRRRNDFRYTPDVEVARVLSFGHRSTVADAIWLRALPDFAREFDDKALKERWLSGVFAVVTDLDPSFYTAYSYGATYLALINRKADSAIGLLERGVDTFERLEAEDGRQYPAGTRLRIDLAMTYWMYKKDRAKTLEQLDVAVARPDCDFLTRGMRVGLALDDRDDLLALTYSAQLLEHPNADVRAKAELDFEFTKLKIARRAVREFTEREGHAPTSVDDLRASGLLDAAVAEVVFQTVQLAADGTLSNPRYDELDLASTIRAMEDAAAIYRRDHGAWPDEAWLLRNPLVVPDERHVRGKRVVLDDDGHITLVPAE